MDKIGDSFFFSTILNLLHDFGIVFQNMKANKSRREQFMFSAEQSSSQPTISTSSPSDYIPTAASELHHRRKTHCGSCEFSPILFGSDA